MGKRSMGLVLTVYLSALGLAAFEGSPAPAAKAGSVLLDQYVKCFQEMATRGTGGKDFLEPYLLKMAADTKKAKEQNEIDLVFYTHFSRLLAMTKLLVEPDPGKILWPIIDREAANFVKDVTGEDLVTSGGAPAIGQVANALAEEIVNLQVYLDTADKRMAIRKKMEGSLAGPKK
jgi:hypothetical protein